jgi:uncharacterized protein (DUF58 family)
MRLWTGMAVAGGESRRFVAIARDQAHMDAMLRECLPDDVTRVQLGPWRATGEATITPNDRREASHKARVTLIIEDLPAELTEST